MNLDELFNMSGSIEEVTTEPVKRKVDANLYSINLNDAQDGIYRAKLRFIPNFRNVKKSIISKYTYWLTDANEENGIYVDDPSTIGEKSPIGDMFWKLKNSKNPVDNNLSDLLKRGRKFCSLVQIIEDIQHPEFEGRLMVFSYGIKIKEKIDSEFKDEDEGGNPFDVFNGRLFRVEVKKVGGFQNYDSCKFIGGATPIKLDGKSMTGSEADKKKIVEFIEKSPVLEDYDFKPWSAELTEQVNERLATYRHDGKSTGAKKPVIEAAISQEDVDVDTDEYEEKVDTKSEDDDFLEGIDL